MTQAGLLCSRSPRERHSNRANGTNYDHLMDRSANSPRRSKAFVNAVTWLDPRACGPNERMWRVKMAWVWVAPCLFVAFALPVLASGALSSEQRAPHVRVALVVRTDARFARPGARRTSMGLSPATGRSRSPPALMTCVLGVVVVAVGWWCWFCICHAGAHAELTQSSRRAHAELTQSSRRVQL